MKTEYYMGERDLASVRLSPRERTQLTNAAVILERLRKLRGWDSDDEVTVDVAMAAHTCRDLAEEGVIQNP